MYKVHVFHKHIPFELRTLATRSPCKAHKVKFITESSCYSIRRGFQEKKDPGKWSKWCFFKHSQGEYNSYQREGEDQAHQNGTDVIPFSLPRVKEKAVTRLWSATAFRSHDQVKTQKDAITSSLLEAQIGVGMLKAASVPSIFYKSTQFSLQNRSKIIHLSPSPLSLPCVDSTFLQAPLLSIGSVIWYKISPESNNFLIQNISKFLTEVKYQPVSFQRPT